MNVWTWGLDIALERVDICVMAEGFDTGIYAIGVKDDAEDLSSKLLALQDALQEQLPLLVQDYPPFSVWIEQPIGKSNPSLAGAYGIILAALRRTLRGTTPFPVTIFPVTATAVRKAIVGRGNCTKPETQNAMIDLWPFMRYKSVDAAEAMATCLYGLRMTGDQIR
jgi:Holliday junction resolvasome RuvABC endonuclease subunit